MQSARAHAHRATVSMHNGRLRRRRPSRSSDTEVAEYSLSIFPNANEPVMNSCHFAVPPRALEYYTQRLAVQLRRSPAVKHKY